MCSAGCFGTLPGNLYSSLVIFAHFVAYGSRFELRLFLAGGFGGLFGVGYRKARKRLVSGKGVTKGPERKRRGAKYTSSLLLAHLLRRDLLGLCQFATAHTVAFFLLRKRNVSEWRCQEVRMSKEFAAAYHGLSLLLGGLTGLVALVATSHCVFSKQKKIKIGTEKAKGARAK